MADLIDVLPNFDLAQWRHLTYSLEKKNVSTAELIALDPVEIARKCPLPLTEVRRLAAAVLQALKVDLAVKNDSVNPSANQKTSKNSPPRKKARIEPRDQPLTARPLPYVKTLDPRIDQWLGGGFPVGSICEIVGESAVGKTQFVLSLLMSAQLPPPDGLGKSVIYISTEGSLNTARLMQILRAHPVYQDLPVSRQPSLDRVLTVDAPTLEAQERIVHYQLEEVVKRRDIGLVVIDSIAANYRVEYQGASRKVLGERAMALVRLGTMLRKISHEHRVAVVVTNQVSDRFDDERTIRDKIRLSQSQSQSSQATRTQGSSTTQRPTTRSPSDTAVKETYGHSPSSWPPQALPERPPTASQAKREELLSLDFQQRFFTGWGDDPKASVFEPLKTPALGLAWANQIDARIVLKVSQQSKHAPSETGNIWSDAKRRRYLKLVFASWMKPTVAGIEYQLEMQGPVSLLPKNAKETKLDDDLDAGPGEDNEEFEKDTEHAELLDPKYWEDEDEEFP